MPIYVDPLAFPEPQGSALEGVVRVKVPEVEGIPVPQRTLAVRVAQTQEATVEWVVRDDGGRPIDLTTLNLPDDVTAASSSSSSSGQLPPLGVAKVRLREAIYTDPRTQWETTAVAHEAQAGVLRFTVPAGAVALPGVLRVELGLFSPAGNMVISQDFYIIVDRGQFGTDFRPQGVPTVADIRTQLRDSDPNDNFLIAVLEFELGEVAYSLVRAVAMWNETQPRIKVAIFTTTTFPDAASLTDGVIGFLYEAAAHNYRRNHLAYAAAGVQVDDKNKAAEYQQMGAAKLDAFKKWVQARKVSMNAMQAVGSLRSAYSRAWF